MNLLPYLIQVNIYLVLFYAFYELVLQNETFFKWNRVFLVGSGALSFLIPLMQSDWIRTMFLTEEIEEVTQVTFMLNEIQIQSTVSDNSWTMYEWISLIYLTGVVVYLARFIWRLSRVSESFKQGTQAQSFFGKIKVSENLPSRDSIVKHEEIHASQLHSADVIFFELVSIINWFNPVVYGYKKSAKYIHEFIADEAAASDKGKSEYALLLVSSVFGIQKEQLTNNFFNHSLLKKRIIMLHKSKSGKMALLKYGLSAPLFAAMVILSSAAISKEEINSISSPDNATPKITVATKAKENVDEKLKVSKETTKATNENLAGLLSASKAVSDTSKAISIADVEKMPEYPGGIGKFLEWIGQNYQLPKQAEVIGIGGRMIVQFVVEKDGTLSDIKAIRDLGFGTGEEAMRVIATSKKWNPGTKIGIPVKVKYTLPITIIPKEKEKSETETPAFIFRPEIDPKNPPLFIVDGKEIDYAELLKLKSTDIESASTLKDKKAIEKYGDKGKNGAIIITLQKKEGSGN